MLHKFLFKICLLYLAIVFWGCREDISIDKKQITILGENSATMLALQRDSGAYKLSDNFSILYKPVDYEDSIPSILKNFDLNYGLNDMVLLYNFSFPEIINSNFVYNFDDLVKDEPKDKFNFVNDILPNAWSEGGSYFHSVGGSETQPTKINYPVAMNTMVLVYNKKMFEDEENKKKFEIKYNRKLTIPTEWSEFYDIASFFTNTEKNTFGVAMQGDINGYLYYEFCNYFFGMGAKVFDKNSGWSGNKNTPVIVNNNDAIKATQFYKSLKPFNNGNFIHVDGSIQNNLMKEGKTAMAVVWSDYLTYYCNNVNGVWSDQFGFAPIPGKISPLQGAYIWVNKKSPAANESAKYVLFCLQKENQIRLMQKGLSSAQKSVYDAPEVKAIPFSDAVKKSIERGAYMFEYGPDVNIVSQSLTKNIQDMWLDKISVKQALDNIKQDIETKRLLINYP